MPGQLRKDDVGSVLRVAVKENGVPFNASSASVMALRLSKPSGAVIDRTPSFESTGVDGVFVYAVIAGDLSEAGPWSGQLNLTLPTGLWHTDPFNFVVGDNL